MRLRTKKQTQTFSLLIIVLMLFSLISPSLAHAQPDDRIQTSVNKSQSSDNKLSERLIELFDEEEKVLFLVKFKEKADSMSVAEEAKRKAVENKASTYQQEYLQRSAVISELKTTALESQKNVTTLLEKEMEKDNVESIKNFHIVNGMAVSATKEVAEKIAAFPEVEKILPNEERYLLTESPTEELSKIPQSDNDVEWNIDRIDAPAVWGMGIDGSGVVVATLDSGVQWDHPALKEKYRGFNSLTGEVDHEYSFYDALDGETEAYDDNGHGTHVTGTMVGSEPDGSAAIGVAPGAEWIAAKVFSAAGSTNDAALLDAAQWMLAPGGNPDMAPDVINNSWGGGPGLDEWYRDTVINWRAAGILPVFAAGNVTFTNPGGPGSVAVPANYPESFAVGNTDEDDMIHDSSLRGPSPYEEIKPDVSAPGTGIRSAMPGSEYGLNTGTSMAAPAVSGIVALMLSVNGSLTIDEIEETIMETATERTDDEYEESPNNGYGHGIANAFEAVTAVSSGTGIFQGQVVEEGEDTEAPTYEHEAPEFAYQGTDLELAIQAMDNVSVSEVELHFMNQSGDWETLEANRYEGGFQDGVYGVTVPGDSIEEGTLTYYWEVTDYGENTVTSEEYNIEVRFGVTTGYFEDFETEPMGWYSFGDQNSWEWGVPTSGPESAYSGEKLYATNLSGPYDHNMDATLVMPPIELPEGESYLQFKSWHIFQDHGGTGEPIDYGHVVVSTDMEEWEQLEMIASESAGWEDIEVDLMEYSGERIYLGFNAYSNQSVFRDGWYIDDVQLSEDSLAEKDEEPPTFNHVSPDRMFEGMDLYLENYVEDNLGVATVEVEYKKSNEEEWESLLAEQESGSDREGNFTVWIPNNLEAGEVLDYRWRINDFGDNEITSDVYEIEVHAGVTTGYFENFESGPAGWFSYGTNNPWEHGIPTSGPEEAVSGENVFATVLSGEYYHEMDARLVMPAIDVPEDEFYLQFKSWHQFETNSLGSVRDWGELQISTDLEEWVEIRDFTGLEEEWKDIEIDLSDYSGERIYVGFYVYSNTLNLYEGWYIDDVALSTESLDLPEEPEQETTQASGNVEKTEKHLVETTSVGLPLAANVSVLETGISTSTNPADGTYSLRHAAGEFTLKAEKYGYYPEERAVDLDENETVEAIFMLEEMPQFNLNGTVTSEKTGSTIENATLLLVEDANVDPVETDADGSYSLTAYEGTYTLRIVAENYHTKEIEVSLGDNKELMIELEPFFTYPGGEIGYDDGTPENARAFYDSGNGWAVKMSLEEGQNTALVTDGVFQFHGTDFPSPGDTAFNVEVWSSGEDGMPDERLAGPIEAEAIRDLNEWTVVNLSEHNIKVNGDFFMVYIQDGFNPNVPGLATDENGPIMERSYQYIDGSWEQTPLNEGNYMIRARVNYEVEEPILNESLDNTYTNESAVILDGSASPTTTVILHNNGEEIGQVDTGDDGLFSMDTELEEGVNEFTATAMLYGEEIKESAPVTITLDTISPELTIDNPVDGYVTNRDTVMLEGNVQDNNLKSIEVNGLEASADNNGNYSLQVLLEEGENNIEVIAEDLAGNVTTEEIVVTADYQGPTIEQLEPTEDQYLMPGDDMTIRFASDTINGKANFKVQLLERNEIAQASENNMVEVEPGVYEGVWTIPEVSVDGAVIVVEITDEAGNLSTEEAPGKVFIQPSDEIERIEGDSRYQTAVEISQDGWSEADTVVLARGDDFADALSGVPLAHQLDAPILLTLSDRLLDYVLLEIERLGVENIIVLGGTEAIGESVTNELRNEGYEIDRVDGETRFETAAMIAEMMAPEGTKEVVVTNGMDFPDTLSIASFAAQNELPILLTTADSLPEATKDAITASEAEKTLVIGGPKVVSEEVVGELPGAHRLGGDTRFETNIEVVEYFNLQANDLYVATGMQFADALSGAVLAAKEETGILLVFDRVPEVIESYINSRNLRSLTIFGGTVAVNEEVENKLIELLQ